MSPTLHLSLKPITYFSFVFSGTAHGSSGVLSSSLQWISKPDFVGLWVCPWQALADWARAVWNTGILQGQSLHILFLDNLIHFHPYADDSPTSSSGLSAASGTPSG